MVNGQYFICEHDYYLNSFRKKNNLTPCKREKENLAPGNYFISLGDKKTANQDSVTI